MEKKSENIADDKALWQAMQQGDKEAFSKIYRLHAEAMFKYGLHLTSNADLLKDTIQDLFLETWSNRQRLASVSNIRFYLLKALRFKLLRTLKKHRTTILQLANLDLTNSPEEEWIAIEIQETQSTDLQKALGQLPQRQQEAIHLRYFHAIRHEEIADMMGINYQSVSNLLHKGLCSLRAALKGKYLGNTPL